MQETHSLKTCENKWTNQFGCGNKHIAFSRATSDIRGMLISGELLQGDRPILAKK